MLRKIVLFCIVLGLSFTLFAQRIVVNPEPTREANVLHAKRIWRVIDLREKKNVTAKSRHATQFQMFYTMLLYQESYAHIGTIH